MKPVLRMLLVAVALLTSSAMQLAVALGDDACCPEEQDEGAPDCPPGLACACCPVRGAVQFATPELAPATSPGVAVVTAAAEPSLGAAASDIFHPLRA